MVNSIDRSVIVYDIEIINPIRSTSLLVGDWKSSLEGFLDANPNKEIKFCSGWKDYGNMGIACIGVYDYQEDRYRTFLKDNLSEFQALINSRNFIVGYNNFTFDDQILKAESISLDFPESWDLLSSIWNARQSLGMSKKGTGLDGISKANNLPGKSGDGMLAALNWQMGNYGQTIDYCLRDVWLTKKLLDILAVDGNIVDAEGNILDIQLPWIY